MAASKTSGSKLGLPDLSLLCRAPKTIGSKAYVGVSTGLQEELEIWIPARLQKDSYHASFGPFVELAFPLRRSAGHAPKLLFMLCDHGVARPLRTRFSRCV
jgi:hypothetical protein